MTLLTGVKKIVSAITLALFLTTNVYAAPKIVKVGTFKGLKRSPSADKADGFVKFDNVYIDEGNLRAVKGRDRLNSTALANTTTNGIWYYENFAGTTKKIVRMENTVLASYDVDGTNRTQLNTGLTNEKHDAKQIGDILYITSDTDGLYKWTGSGAATAISGVSAPSTVDFSSTTSPGGMTSGDDAVITPAYSTSNQYWRGSTGTSACFQYHSYINSTTTVASATNTTYSYKVSKWNSKQSIESEPSTADTATVTGSGTGTLFYTTCYPEFSDAACATLNATRCNAATVSYSGARSGTSGTMASAPTGVFDGYCVYRSVANGSDYFKQGCFIGGGNVYTDGTADSDLGPALDTTIDTITPPSYRYIGEFKGAMFLAQGTSISFSRTAVSAGTDLDTYWLATDTLDTGSSSPITGMHNTGNSLLFFMSNKVMELTGFGVQTFRFRTILSGVGSVSDEAIETDNNGDIIFFAGQAGVYKLKIGEQRTDPLTGSVNQGGAVIERISSPDLDNVFTGVDSQIVLSASDYANSHAYYDNDNDLYFLYIGQECFIFNNSNNQWSHLPATQMSASVFAKSPSVVGKPILTDNVGFMYRNWTGYENGIESGSVTGVITASGNTTLTCGACTFNTTGDGLKGLWIYLNNDDGEWRQIASNTGTQITVSSAWTVNPITSDTFYVGYVIPDFTTRQFEQMTQDAVPLNTRTHYFYLIHGKSESAQTLYYQTYENKKTYAENEHSIDLSVKFIEKLNIPMRANWVQFNFKTYIYNISNSIDNPLDINSYAVELEEGSEDIA